jgi:hypothetical protein
MRGAVARRRPNRSPNAHDRHGARRAARALALLASIAALAALGASSALAAGARAGTLPRCATAGLVIWLNPEDSGALGSFYFKLEFTNLSGHTCTLAGYPGVSAVNLRGRQVGSPAGREVTGPPGVVTLAPEAQVAGLLHVVDVAVLPASCRQTTAAGLRVYPPGERASKIVPFPFRTCAKLGDSPMSVRSVKLE